MGRWNRLTVLSRALVTLNGIANELQGLPQSRLPPETPPKDWISPTPAVRNYKRSDLQTPDLLGSLSLNPAY
jgi:hypothetical protein